MATLANPVAVKTRRLTLSILMAIWIPPACLLIWVWPIAAVAALVSGWWLARWAGSSTRYDYAVAMGPSMLSTAAVMAYSLARPDPAFGYLLAQMAALQFLCALAAFVFVRHVLQPAGQ